MHFGCFFSHLFIFTSDLLHLHWTCNVVVLLLPAVNPRYAYRYAHRYGMGKGRHEGLSIHGVREGFCIPTTYTTNMTSWPLWFRHWLPLHLRLPPPFWTTSVTSTAMTDGTGWWKRNFPEKAGNIWCTIRQTA